jgi:hypothetical protein
VTERIARRPSAKNMSELLFVQRVADSMPGQQAPAGEGLRRRGSVTSVTEDKRRGSITMEVGRCSLGGVGRGAWHLVILIQ